MKIKALKYKCSNCDNNFTVTLGEKLKQFEDNTYICKCNLFEMYCERIMEEESLAHKIYNCFINGPMFEEQFESAKKSAQIAKEHHQQHPEEIGCVNKVKMLEAFDNSFTETEREFFNLSKVRKSLEQL